MAASPHPGGRILELLSQFKITRRQLATHIGMRRTWLDRVIRGESPVGLKLAIKLSQTFQTSTEYWVYAQALWDFQRAREELKKEGTLPKVPSLSVPRDLSQPGPLDRCVCGHWGWDHILGPEGACIGLKADETDCGCGMYIRMYGYLKAMEATNGIKDRLDEEQQRLANTGSGNDGGVSELRGDGVGPAEAGSAGNAVEGEAGQDPTGRG